MQKQGETAPGALTRPARRQELPDIVASDRERARAFRRARRHTWLVRLLRLALPAFALASAGVYGAALMASAKLKGRDISVGRVTVDPNNLTMDDPRYEGFAKDGGQYKLHARTAMTDLKMSGPVQLKDIDGQLIQPTGAVTSLTARSGSYDQKKERLELYEQIDVVGSTGMKARLTRATIHTGKNRIDINEPIYAETATGQIRANGMTLDSRTRQAAFRDAVEVVLKANPAAVATDGADAGRAVRREPALPGVDPGSGEPVVVRSARLDVDDNAKTALFRDNVVARQGEAMLEAPELDVLYEGRATAEPAPAGAGSQDGGAADATRLKAILARGGVVLSNKMDRATAQTLEFDAASEVADLAGEVVMTQAPDRRVTAEAVRLDQKADTALLTGDVVIAQGRNVMRAAHVLIDRKAGTAKLKTAAPDAGRPAAERISTVFYQNQQARPGAPGKAEAADAMANGPLGAAFKGDPDAPIEVEALTLEVHDRKHAAVYAGHVVARQGAFVVRTDTMTAHYAGETGLAAGLAPQAPSAKPKTAGAGTAELKRIEARGHVVVTGREGQQATGEWANFDVKANTVVMGGNVVVTQGKQVVRAPEGMRLVIDLGSGLTRFEGEPGAQARSGPQVSGAFATSVAPSANGSGNPQGCPPGAICKSGRLEAIFYPHQLKQQAEEKAKTVRDSVDKATVDKGIAAAAGAASELKRKVPRVSPDGWLSGTTTEGSGSR